MQAVDFLADVDAVSVACCDLGRRMGDGVTSTYVVEERAKKSTPDVHLEEEEEPTVVEEPPAATAPRFAWLLSCFRAEPPRPKRAEPQPKRAEPPRIRRAEPLLTPPPPTRPQSLLEEVCCLVELSPLASCCCVHLLHRVVKHLRMQQ